MESLSVAIPPPLHAVMGTSQTVFLCNKSTTVLGEKFLNSLSIRVKQLHLYCCSIRLFWGKALKIAWWPFQCSANAMLWTVSPPPPPKRLFFYFVTYIRHWLPLTTTYLFPTFSSVWIYISPYQPVSDQKYIYVPTWIYSLPRPYRTRQCTFTSSLSSFLA